MNNMGMNNMGMNDIAIGNLVVSRVVEDARALFDTARFFPDSTEDAIADAHGWMGERFFDAQSGCFVLAVQSYVARAGGRTILIDACVGNHKQGRRCESWNGGNLADTARLARIIRPA